MSLKVEILQSNNYNPPFLIVDDYEIYPILDIKFEGELETYNAVFNKPFNIISRRIIFKDVFNKSHIIEINKKDEEYSKKCWENRLKILAKQQLNKKRKEQIE